MAVPGPDYQITWSGVQPIPATDITCGYCGREVSSTAGWTGQGRIIDSVGQVVAVDTTTAHRVVVCPRCNSPTYVRGDVQTPGVTFGEAIDYLPTDIAPLYEEARTNIGVGNFNSAVMVARKLLMNVAVTKGAAAGGTFKSYVEHLENEGVVTADMKDWVDEIRELGNDANHELPHMTRDEAEAILTFVAMLLKIVYEYPERGRRSVAARATKSQPTAGESSS